MSVTIRQAGQLLMIAAMFQLGSSGCRESNDDFDAICAYGKHDPGSWELSVESALYVFVGKVVSIEQTCSDDPDYQAPVVLLEVTEAIEGVEVGDQISLKWWERKYACTPDVVVDEEWVIVAQDDSYNAACAPGGRLSDPDTEDFLEWLYSRSAS